MTAYKRRIIAGGTGFIGQNLVNKWLKENIPITVIGRDATKIRILFKDNVTALTWNEIVKQGIPDLNHAEVIINLAGANVGNKRWTKQRKQEILDSRIIPTTTLAKLCAELGENSPALFNANGVGIYGLQKEEPEGLPAALDEQTPIDYDINYDKESEFLCNVAKRWEQATFIAKEKGVRVVTMRFGVVLDKSGGVLPKITAPFYYYLGGIIGSGQQPFCWIALTDLIAAIEFLIHKPEIHGPINCVAPQCITQKRLAHSLGNALNKPNFAFMPEFMLKLMLGEMANELILHGQHVIPRRLLDHDFEFKYADIDSALAAIYKK